MGSALLTPPFAFCSDPSKSDVIRRYGLDELHEEAPSFVFTDALGKAIDFKTYRGKSVLLHFWASWCEPCRKELPELKKLVSEPGGESWVFLPISVDAPKDRGKALKFIRELKAKIPLNSLRTPGTADKYLTWGLPVTFWIDSRGEIVARALGKRDWLAKPDAARDLNSLFQSNQNR